MKRNNRFLLSIIISICFYLFSCKTAEFGNKVLDVNGMVYDFSNRPVPNFEISLDKDYNCSTDINGRFTLQKVPIGAYTLTGNKAGFERYEENVFIRENGQIIYIRLPSQNQLLHLVDEALGANDFDSAEALAERAYQIDKKNVEMLLYYASVKFRKKDLIGAIGLLEATVNLGSRDPYINKFLSLLKELKNENEPD
ncbi:MAG: carboxypeptidase regulatory-like domain-containing protein [Treponema sp.]|jgi:hypothetical protein|nr:carboxypeptidase regulatory-like domain-containing protein [Treponema sp.]